MSRTDACILRRSIRTLWFTLALCFPMIAASQTVEFFIQADFAAEVGSRNVIGFDIPNQADGALAGEEYLGCGLTIIQIDGNDINIVGNLAPGSFGGNYVTEANIDSAPNAISSSTNVGGAADQPDNFDLVFSESTAAAGVVVGNLGNCNPVYSTTVQFLDGVGAVIAEAILAQDHPDVVWGTADGGGICGGTIPVPFDNRLFYGIVTDQMIDRIRVLNAANDGDGIVIDSVQFSSQTICGCGFESGDVCLSMSVHL